LARVSFSVVSEGRAAPAGALAGWMGCVRATRQRAQLVPASVSTSGGRLDFHTGAPSPMDSFSLSRFDLDSSTLEEHAESEHGMAPRGAPAEGVKEPGAGTRRAPEI